MNVNMDTSPVHYPFCIRSDDPFRASRNPYVAQRTTTNDNKRQRTCEAVHKYVPASALFSFFFVFFLLLLMADIVRFNCAGRYSSGHGAWVHTVIKKNGIPYIDVGE